MKRGKNEGYLTTRLPVYKRNSVLSIEWGDVLIRIEEEIIDPQVAMHQRPSALGDGFPYLRDRFPPSFARFE